MTSLVQTLESRTLMAAVAAAVAPTDAEQLLVELVNRARSDPVAEANRYGIDLNEGLASGSISPNPVPPLAISPYLTSSARGHSQWMLDNDVFSHTGAGGSDPMGRMSAAGYSFTPPWSAGENIAWRGTKPGVPDLVATTARLHQDFFVDTNYPGRGHRVNLLSPAFKEIGAGVIAGEFQTYNAAMATEDFASSGAGNFLTGVAYTDAVVHDNFYTPGEGIGGVSIVARRTSDGATYSTTTYNSGGYSLKLPAGTYDVTGSATALGGTVSYGDVAVGSANVKRDFLPNSATNSATVVGRHLFYNNSSFDGANPAANSADDAAIDPTKAALLPTHSAPAASYSSYFRGINGVMIDLSSTHTDLTAADFTLQVSTDPAATAWAAAPAPTAITRRVGAGTNGSDRVTLTFPDFSITNRWLRVTVNANADTALASPDVFYFGNLVGDALNASPNFPIVSALDLGAAKAAQNQSGLPVTSLVDFNHDGRITAIDLAVAKSNLNRTLTLISV